jgi:peptide/nickel transport system permease protein
MQQNLALAGAAARGERRMRSSVLRRFARNRLAVFGLVVFGLVVLLCVFGPFASRFGPNTIDLSSVSLPPSATHWFGTDETGRDMFARTLAAGQVSLTVGLLSALLSVVLGLLFGGVAGYFGGKIDMLIMRLVDVVMIFPTTIVLLTLAAVLGPGTGKTIVIVGVLTAPLAVRLVRARVLTVRELDFVAAARLLGAGDAYIIVRHCLPNTTDVIVSFASLNFVSAIMMEAGLSFLGLGVQMPFASWGSLLSLTTDASMMQAYPWMWMPAGILIVVTALAANFFGDGLRAAFDPKSNQEQHAK